ncbi:MAG: 4-hydroxy-tetrahydrodipicolinate synthase [Bacteroidales bacterium]|nr:4-hydroxy-tetrahydrodipicolinate synthase [Bacteroidales bacterium]MCF8333690.1 4-hydroxy-tetrahydrodipicolinate synthase [Bacteroidales bacterium]
MMKNKFQGTGVAIVTPFRKYGTIDFGSLEKLIEHIVGNGVNFIVALGTTGESATLTHDEKNAVIDFVCETVNGRVPVVVGVGGNNTEHVIKDLRSLNLSKSDGILSVAPYYNKPQPKGLYNHFKNIASASSLPVILYNVPGRTGSNIPADITLQLAYDIENIVAIKEASGDLAQIETILQERPEDFAVVSGDDGLTLPLIALGANGVISVTANAFPKEFSAMVNHALNNDFEKARKNHYQLKNVMETLFADGNPAGIKAALDNMGLVSNNLRLPLVKVNKSVNNQIKKAIEDFGV